MGEHVRPLGAEDVREAMALVHMVFSQFEAPEYSPQGVAEFEDYIRPENIRRHMEDHSMLLWGWFGENGLAGVLACCPLAHISLLFVDPLYHRRGIARALLNPWLALCRRQGAAVLTVNSSPYAEPIYRRLGFTPVDGEQCVNGIRFVPMKRELALPGKVQCANVNIREKE